MSRTFTIEVEISFYDEQGPDEIDMVAADIEESIHEYFTLTNIGRLEGIYLKEEPETKFYPYRQNNAGGNFIGAKHIIIEAASAEEANEIAENRGMDFGPSDCQCCGPRWRRVQEEDGMDSFSEYSELSYRNEEFLLIKKKKKKG